MAQKRRKRKPLDIADIRASMSTAIQELENIFMDTTNEADTRIRAINSLGTLANSYARLVEVDDLQKRVEKLETPSWMPND